MADAQHSLTQSGMSSRLVPRPMGPGGLTLVGWLPLDRAPQGATWLLVTGAPEQATGRPEPPASDREVAIPSFTSGSAYGHRDWAPMRPITVRQLGHDGDPHRDVEPGMMDGTSERRVRLTSVGVRSERADRVVKASPADRGPGTFAERSRTRLNSVPSPNESGMHATLLLASRDKQRHTLRPPAAIRTQEGLVVGGSR